MKIKLSPVKQINIHRLKKNKKNEQYFNPVDGDSIKNLKDDIQRRGIIVPLIAMKDGTLLAGHSRLMVAGQLNMKNVPVQYIEQKLTERQQIEFIIKDNLIRRHLSPDERKVLYRKIYPDLDDRLLVFDKDCGVDITKIADETGLLRQTVNYDINHMRHKKKRELAAAKQVDFINQRAIDNYKKSCARMLNVAIVEQKSTLSEFILITESSLKKLKAMDDLNAVSK